jgi:methionine sulfoxide reductase heme-binding subunit
VILDVVTSKTDWYVVRGTGLVALVLLSLAVSLGVVGVRHWRSPRWPGFVTAGLHRSVALLAVCFLAVHITTAVLDQWIGLGWVDVLVPFRSPYRPLWVGLGTVAFDVGVAVVATSLLRRHLSHRLWRTVHWGAWVLWPLAVVHALGAGSDTRAGWGLAVLLSCVGLVGAAAAWRFGAGLRRSALPLQVAQHGEHPAVVGGRRR